MLVFYKIWGKRREESRPLQLSRAEEQQSSEVGKMDIALNQAFEPSHTESLHGASGLSQGLLNPQNNRHLTAYWSRFRAAMECHSFCGERHDDYTTRAARCLKGSVILNLFSQCDQMQGFRHSGHLCGVLESTERAHSADLSETVGVTSHSGDTRLNLKK